MTSNTTVPIAPPVPPSQPSMPPQAPPKVAAPVSSGRGGLLTAIRNTGTAGLKKN